MKMKFIKTRVNKKSKKSGEKGQALIIVLALMVVGIMIITSSLAFLGTSIKTNKVYINNTNDLYAAEAGLQDGIYNILNKTEDQLNTLFMDANPINPPYKEYDYFNTWTYNLPNQINNDSVSVKLQNMWVPLIDDNNTAWIPSVNNLLPPDGAITPPSLDKANAILNNTNFIVSGGIYSIPLYTLTITAQGNAVSLPITSIGVWLPQGFTYDNDSSKLVENVPGTKELLVPCVGNQAVIWKFPQGTTYTTLLNSLGQTGQSSITITFTYTTNLQKLPKALSWVVDNTTANTAFPYAYTVDFDIHQFDLISDAGQTEIETYSPKSASRDLGTTISGDYVAIGNSLMVMGKTEANDKNGVRYNALNDSSYIVSTIPSDADVQGAYLYWTGWFDGSETLGPSYGGRVSFQINGNQVCFDAKGNYTRGTGAISCSTFQTDNDPSVGANSVSYSCRVDVTKLLQGELKAENTTAANYPGNATYDVGPYNFGLSGGCILGVTPANIPSRSNASAEGCYAGWSLVIIYSSPTTLGHQLYLFDKFSNGQSNSDIDPTTGGKGPGGVISGFIVPHQDAGTQDTNPQGAHYVPAATLTAFVGEGDWCYSGDFIAFNAPQPSSVNTAKNIAAKYKLWDGVTLSDGTDSSTNPNNVWNSNPQPTTGQTGLVDGVDVKTFTVTWESQLLQFGATHARIDLPTQTDQWNLVYIILSFRSSVTSGGSISYIIRHK